MVLKRVGERIVDVLVNGNQQASYTQTAERADYDVSVSDGTTSIEVSFSGRVGFNLPDNEWNQAISEYGLGGDNTAIEGDVPDEIRVEATEANGSGDVQIKMQDSSGNYPYNQTGSDLDTGWISNFDNFAQVEIANSSGSATTVDYRISYRWNDIASGYSIDGVTKS